jgi:DNA gyrase/topoisomerase IV subunit B
MKLYTEEDIKILDWKDHMRIRPAMYIGDLSSRGIWYNIYEILSEIIDRSKG